MIIIVTRAWNEYSKQLKCQLKSNSWKISKSKLESKQWKPTNQLQNIVKAAKVSVSQNSWEPSTAFDTGQNPLTPTYIWLLSLMCRGWQIDIHFLNDCNCDTY